MEDTPYTNRELREFFGDVKESLVKIETQTTKTNGRVSKLENWQAYLQGGMAIITLLLIPILLSIVNNYMR